MAAFAGVIRQRTEYLVRIQRVSKEYGAGHTGVKALRQASLTLEPGEFVLLQGPSGSGKTTLLSIMGLLMKPSGGRVWLCGKDVTEMGEAELPRMRLKHIGFIFQTFNLFPALSAFHNVALILKLKGYGWRARRKEAARLLERVGLGECMHRKPGDMSGGQRQRVSIARALAGDSDLILADEPTAALDTATGLEIMTLLKEQTRSGQRAALIVTHDPRLERFATRVDRIIDGTLSVGSGLHAKVLSPHESILSGVSQNTPVGMQGITPAPV
ncbi:MAG TPA: ABC transporter ATP-binding protein [Planctomycetota bacterium]|jgi:putative ABC transport system ATP-binding protein